MVRNTLYALDTHLLLEMMDRADDERFNRALLPEFRDKVDPNGVHISGMQMYAERGVTRLWIMAKMRDTDKPASICVDTEDDLAERMIRLTSENMRDLTDGRECAECGIIAYHMPGDYICHRCRVEHAELAS